MIILKRFNDKNSNNYRLFNEVRKCTAKLK